MLKPLFLLVLFAAAPCAFAKGYSPALTARAGGYDVKFSPSGQPIAVPAVAAVGGSAAQVAAAFQFKWPNGVDAAGAAVSVFTGAKTAGAFGAASAVAGIAAMYAIPAIKQWMETAGVYVRPDGSSGYVDPSTLCSSDCYLWYGRGPNPFMTAAAACSSRTDGTPSSGPWLKITATPGAGSSCRVQYVWQNRNPPNTSDDSDFTFDQSPGASRPSDNLQTVALVPQTPDQLVQRLSLPTPTAAAVQALVDLNFPPEAELPVMTGPLSQFKGNVVSLGLDGTVQEIEERYIASFQPGLIQIGIEKKQTVTTPEKKSTSITTNPDGSTAASVITTPKVSSTLTTTSAGENAADKPSITCGLPGTPPCAIDDSGVPGQPQVDAAMSAKPKDIQKDIDDIARNPVGFFPKFPTLNWAFALPTGCAQIPTPAFAPALTSIDVCQFRPMFHDIMSVVWTLGGLFGAISLFMRNAIAS